MTRPGIEPRSPGPLANTLLTSVRVQCGAYVMGNLVWNVRNSIEPKFENILRKNQNSFRSIRSTTSQILTIRRILEGVRAKNLKATLLSVDFYKAFDPIHKRKMEQILLTDGIPKETVTAIMMLYKNAKVKVHSPDRDTDYFDIVAGVLQKDILDPNLFSYLPA